MANEFMADSPGGASALFMRDQNVRAARADQSFQTMLGALSQSKQQAIQKNQFAASLAMQARQQAQSADMQAQEISLARANHLAGLQKQAQEFDLQNRYLQFQKEQADAGYSPAEARKQKMDQLTFNANYPDATAKAAAGGYDSVDAIKKDLPTATDLQAEQLLKQSLTFRDQTRQHNAMALTVANRLNALKTAPLPTPNPTPTSRIFGPGLGFVHPDQAVQPQDRDKILTSRNKLMADLLAQHSDKVQPNPVTGMFQPVTVPEPWGAKYQGEGGDYDPSLPPPPTASTGTTPGRANSLASSGPAGATSTSTMKAPPNAKEGDVVRQKSTGNVFMVQSGVLVPYDESR